MKVYHGTIKGFWDLGMQQMQLSPIKPKEISDFVSEVSPLLHGYSSWLNNRLASYKTEVGKVYLSDSKKHASQYSITFPEIVTSCITRLSEWVEENVIKEAQLKLIFPTLRNLNKYFRQNGTPIVATIDIPENSFEYTGLPNEIRLIRPTNIRRESISVEEVNQAHSFFRYYDNLLEIMKKNGIKV